MQYEVIKTLPAVKGGHIISDQIVRLNNQRARKAGAYAIRRVEYLDPDSGKTYVFITNQKTWSAQTVADIYKSRWEVELFFKWIKQNLKIKSFLGNTMNAVASQIFVALCVYLLVAFQRFLSQTAYGLERVFRLIQINALVRKPIADLLCPKKQAPPDPQITFKLRAA